MQITRARRAFTLIELVVTIVLLGALTAIAAVSYSAFLTDAQGEISSIEAAQDDRIVAAQTLLDAEGEYQAPAGGLVSLAGRTFSDPIAAGSTTWSAETPILVLDVQGVANTYAFYGNIFSPMGCVAIFQVTPENLPTEYSSDPTVPGSSVVTTHCND